MEERMRILRMLESKEISVEEARVLLEELDKKKTNRFQKEKDEFEEKLQNFSTELGKFLKNTIKIVEDKIVEIFPNDKSE